MECPKCHFDHPLQSAECLRCGIVFSKYRANAAASTATSAATAVRMARSPERTVPPVPGDLMVIEPALTYDEQRELFQKASNELLCRIFALPAALLIGWLIVHTMPLLADMLRMWTHETGHALTAWLSGYPAFPTAWITIRSPQRVPAASFLLAAALAFGGYVAYRMERWFWLVASVLTLVLLLAGNFRTEFQSGCLITFGGDAGSFVVATMLMATFYARPESAMCRKQLRWALLIIGAIAFMDTYSTWAGGFEKIVHWLDDTDERGPTDLARLTQYCGWGIGEMQGRFLQVARFCWLILAAMYSAGILQSIRRKAELAPVTITKPLSKLSS